MMMEDFQEYVLTLNPPVSAANLEILRNAEINSRTLKLPTKDIVEELVTHGMNRLTAMDIVTSAQVYFQEQEQRLQHPLGIFWDVENVRIPTKTSGEEASDKIKQAVRCFGNPVVCNAYFESSDMSTMKPEKRQKLQQCGWNLMDVPHLSKKEVADKVIIVDILLFILDHSAGKEPCTICLISDDTDFSYLLAKLKAYPFVRTVIISLNAQLLKMNADASMRWAVDILKFPVISPSSSHGDLQTVIPLQEMKVTEGEHEGLPEDAITTTTANTVSRRISNNKRPAETMLGNNSYCISNKLPNSCPHCCNCEPSMQDNADESDEWETLSYTRQDMHAYDRDQLVRVMRELSRVTNQRAHLKSRVGIALRDANPQAYDDKSSRALLFDRAIRDGVITQFGTLGNVTIALTSLYR